MSTIFWIVVAVVAVIFIILALKSFPAAKTILGVLVVMVALVAGVYSSVNLYSYYTASGGVYGELSGFFDVNKGTSEEFTFKLTNIELKQLHDDTYSATIVTDTVLELEDTDYCLFVNDMPCMVEESGVDYMIGNYTYNFYDENLELKLQDTLDLKFVFNKTYCQLSVSTEGGAEAVKLWNYYFNKNNFVVKFAKADYVPEEDLGYTEGEAPETCVLTYNVEGVESQALIPVGTQISNITYVPTKTFYNFDGWTLDGETTVNPNYTIQDDTTLIATFSLVDAGLYDNEGNMKASWQNLLDEMQIHISSGTVSYLGSDTSSFEGVLIVKNGVTEIGSFDETNLSAVYMPNSVVTINNEAFDYCKQLEKVVLSENIYSIGKSAFRGCSVLEEIDLPDSVSSIGENAFMSCTSLKEIVIPEGVEKILSMTFYSCSLLSNVQLPTTLTKICADAFAHCDSLSGIVIPENVTTIEGRAFAECLSFRTIYIPVSVETIVASEDNLGIFNWCENLIIYCGAEEKPEGWGEFWNAYDYPIKYHETHWGYTYEEYLAEIQ